jgi:prolyl oligopeptidase PreP (S9A serine peptidase family)
MACSLSGLLLNRTRNFGSYFMIAKKGLLLDGSTPTLLYGYGGFEISLGPRYATTVGISWLERGGVYVEANIRGGGEYGPKWHQVSRRVASPIGSVCIY